MNAGGPRSKPIIAAMALGLATALLVALMAPAIAQPLQDSLMSQEEQARSLEREIAALQEKLSNARHDAVALAERLAEVEKSILECYMEIDRAEAEVEGARQAVNRGLRELYVQGRQDSLIMLISSTDVSDFLAWSEYVKDVTSRQSSSLKALKAKKNHLQDCQDKLLAFKKEEAGIADSADTSAVEAQIEAKQAQLVGLTSTLIGMQLPDTYTPAPKTFSPSKVYARPDVNGFNRTGQVMSGYASLYGDDFDGRPTASGEIFDQYAFTCAHKTLPFGTWLLISFRGRSVVVKVNDRGPAAAGRMLDLSKGAADAIGLTGVQWVDCELVVPRS